MKDTSATYLAYSAKAEEGIKALEILREETSHPMEIMSNLLMKIIDDNKDTEYGREHDFANIHSIEDFRKNVPVITYEDIANRISRMMKGEKNVLTAYPFNHFNDTSGTVGAPKAIPMTAPQAQVFMKYNNSLMYGILEEKLGDSWKYGRTFCTTSSGNCRTLESGLTIGDASSKMAEYLKGGEAELDAMMRTMFTTPVEGLTPKPGTDVKYILTRFALADRNLTGLFCGFFSVLVLFLKYIADNYEILTEDIETGTINEDIEMPDEVRQSLLKKIEPMPERAAELREIFKNGSDFPYAVKVWPNLSYIIGVGGDGFSIYDRQLTELYTGPDVTRIYSGITASEGLWTVPYDINTTASVIAPGSAFIEFLPVEAGDDFSQCRNLDELEEGKIYELIITNVCGFYRYRMSDAVKVVGKYNNTPTVEFMYRVNRTVNLAAEKTTEKALQLTVEKTAEELGIQISDYCVYPDTTVTPNRYVFLLEPRKPDKTGNYPQINEVLYSNLVKANPVIRECVDDKWLQKPEVFFTMPETSLLYRDLMVMKGASLNQFKPVRVISNEDQRKFFMGLREE